MFMKPSKYIPTSMLGGVFENWFDPVAQTSPLISYQIHLLLYLQALVKIYLLIPEHTCIHVVITNWFPELKSLVICNL